VRPRPLHEHTCVVVVPDLDEILDFCAEGPVVCPFVRGENAPAIRVYEAVGMRRVLTYHSVIF